MLEMDASIADLVGADYNPREIDQDSLTRLMASVKRFGVFKPIIARGTTIVAGHQRTKALRAAGVLTAPVYRLTAATTTYDEVRFNQLHNGTDLDAEGDVQVGPVPLGYSMVKHADIAGDFRSPGAPMRSDIAELINRYGAWGCCVATESGRVVHCGQYALSSKLSRKDCLVFGVKESDVAELQTFTKATYGQFCYSNIEVKTYLQTFAQMFRLRPGIGFKSNLYEKHVLAWIKARPKARGLDFGSGQGDYAKMLRAKGHNLKEIEFFRRAPGAQAIDRRWVRWAIDDVCDTLKTNGFFDYVVCDSVLNSVTGIKAHDAVLTCLNAMLPVGGTLFASGRRTERVDYQLGMGTWTGKNRGTEFLDADGFSALYRKGGWFFQKFHTRDQFMRNFQDHGFRVDVDTFGSTSWQVACTKVAQLPADKIAAAIDYEFDLDWPAGQTVDRHTQLKEAYNAASNMVR